MDITIPLQPNSGELRPQHNPPGFSGTRENALEHDPDDTTMVNIRVETIQYGKYAGQPAALIILRFIARFRPGIKRLRSFHISIEYRHDAEGVEQPKVVALAPEDCRGKIFTEERESSASAELGVPLGLPDLTANAGIQRSSAMTREHEMRLSGWRRSSADASDNIAVWDCVEAKKAAKGVLPNFRALMIVKYSENEPFHAVLRLDVDRGVWNAGTKLFDWLTLFGKREDDPLLFDPRQPVGTPVAVEDFRDLDLDELVKLQPIPVLPSGYN